MFQAEPKKKSTSWITIALLCVSVGLFVLFVERDTVSLAYHTLFPRTSDVSTLPESTTYGTFINAHQEQTEPADTEEQEVAEDTRAFPAEFLLDVPFTPQAPHANWDEPYDEACEEASALLVHYYYQGKSFTPDVADTEIQAFVSFENSYFGFYKDTTAAQTAEVITEYLGYSRVDVLTNPSADDIKWHISQGRPVIVPAAGRQLENPYFQNPGPLYHMFVVTGYTEQTFITNDVGTRRGEDFQYSISNIMESMHDWNGGDVDSGAKRVIVVYPAT